MRVRVVAVVVLSLMAAGSVRAWSIQVERTLASARRAISSGDLGAAREALRCSMEAVPVTDVRWSEAAELALRTAPELLDEFLRGRTGHLVPEALLRDDVFHLEERPLMEIPERFEALAFLPPKLAGETRFFLGRGEWKAAAHGLEKFLDQRPRNPALLFLLGRIYEEAGWLAASRERYEAVLGCATLDDDLLAARLALIRLMAAEERWFDAERAVQVLTDEARKAVEAFEGGSVLRSGGEAAEARAALLRRRLAFLLNLFCVIKVVKGQPLEARPLVDEALTLTPGRPILALNGIRVVVLTHERDRALRALGDLHAVFEALRTRAVGQLEAAAGLGGGGSVASLRRSVTILAEAVAEVALRVGRVAAAARSFETAAGWFEEARNLQPDAGLPRFYLARIREEEGDRNAAGLAYRQALARSQGRPNLAEACRARVEELFVAEARELLRAKTRPERLAEEAVETLDPDELALLQAELEAGREELRRGDLREGRERFRRLSRAHPRAAEPAYWRGLADLLLGRTGRAVEGFLDALDVDPSHPLARSQLAYLAMERGQNLEKALADSGRALGARPDEPVIQVNHAWILFRLGERREAYALIEKAMKASPREPLFHYRAGLMYFRDEIYDFALAKFREALSLLPGHPRTLMMEGLTLARLGRIHEALASLSASLEGLAKGRGSRTVVVETIQALRRSLEGGGPARRPPPLAAVTVEEAGRNGRAREIQEQAVASFAGGRVDRARGLLTQGLAASPRYANLAVDLGLLELLEGNLDAARKAFDHALDYNAAEFRAYAGYVHLDLMAGDMEAFRRHMERLDDVPQTLAFSELLDAVGERWRRLLAVTPDDATARYQLGRIRVLSGDSEGGLEDLEKGEGPDRDLWRGEAALRLFVLRRGPEWFGRGQEWLRSARFGHLLRLPDFRDAVLAPPPSVPTAQVPVRVVLDREGRWSDETRQAVAASPRILHSLTTLPSGFTRRWKTVDGLLEAQRRRDAARRQREDDVARQLERDGSSLVGPGAEEPPVTGTGGGASTTSADAAWLPPAGVPGSSDEILRAAREAALVEPRAGARSFEPGTDASRTSPDDSDCPSVPAPSEAPRSVVASSEPRGHRPTDAQVRAQEDAVGLARGGFLGRAREAMVRLLLEAPSWDEPVVDLAVLDLLAGTGDEEAAAPRPGRSGAALSRVSAAAAAARGEVPAPLSDEAVTRPLTTPLLRALVGTWEAVLKNDGADPDAVRGLARAAFVAGDWERLARAQRMARGTAAAEEVGRLALASVGNAP